MYILLHSVRPRAISPFLGGANPLKINIVFRYVSFTTEFEFTAEHWSILYRTNESENGNKVVAADLPPNCLIFLNLVQKLIFLLKPLEPWY